MRSIFWRPRRAAKPAASRRVRLSLERLETRACPIGGIFQLTSFTSTTLPGHLVRLDGTTAGDPPAGVQISLTGHAAGATGLHGDGSFSYTTTEATLGPVTAQGVVGSTAVSNAMDSAITDTAPLITLRVVYGSQNNITLSGTVTDIDRGNLRVKLRGPVKASALTDADGNFSVSTACPSLGWEDASVVDEWGLNSNPASVNIYAPPPHITSFGGIESPGNIWTFSGTLTDSDPGGLRVYLAGFPSLDGVYATVGNDGRFSVPVQMSPNENGQVLAMVTDWWNLSDSNACIVQQ